MLKTLTVLTIFLLMTGCATKPEPATFPVSPKMATVYADGVTTIAWKSATNLTYTIYYTETPPGHPADWKPLPQGTNLRGTGKQIAVTDQAGSDAARRYLLLIGDQKPYSAIQQDTGLKPLPAAAF